MANQRATRMDIKQKSALVEIVNGHLERNETEVDWEKVASTLNGLGPAVKDALKWKKSCDELKCKAKKRAKNTSGKQLNALDEKLVSIASTKISPASKKKCQMRPNNKFTSYQLVVKGLDIQTQFFKDSRRQHGEKLRILKDIQNFVNCASMSLMACRTQPFEEGRQGPQTEPRGRPIRRRLSL